MMSTERPMILLRGGVFVAETVVTVRFGIKNGPEIVWLPLFAAVEPAELFISSLGENGKGTTVFQLANSDELGTLLADLKSLGTTHITFPVGVSGSDPIPIDEAVWRLSNPFRWGAVAWQTN